MTTKLLFQEPSWPEWYIFSVFFVCLFVFFNYLLFPQNVSTLKIKVHSIQNWMPKWIFKVVKSCARKMVERTHPLLNSKMVKNFLERPNSNFGLNQLTSMVDMLCRIINGKFQLLNKVLGSQYTLNFQNGHFSRVKIRMSLVKNQKFEIYFYITNTMKC